MCNIAPNTFPLVASQSNILKASNTLNVNSYKEQPQINNISNNPYVVVGNVVVLPQASLMGHVILTPQEQDTENINREMNSNDQLNQSIATSPPLNYPNPDSLPNIPWQNTGLDPDDTRKHISIQSAPVVPYQTAHIPTPKFMQEQRESVEVDYTKNEAISTDNMNTESQFSRRGRLLCMGYKNPFDYSSYKLKRSSIKDIKEEPPSISPQNEPKTTVNIPTIWGCRICNEKATNKASLIEHYKQRHSEEDYEVEHKCDQCDELFPDLKTLERHSAMHEADETYLCFVCGKVLARRQNFNRHMQTHEGHKKFQCKTCEKFFLRRSTLVAHIRTHTGEKPHKCPMCGKGFAQRTPLVVHQRGHTGDRPYKCVRCKKGFASKYALDTHKICKSYVVQ